jgi:hypothetical protein
VITCFLLMYVVGQGLGRVVMDKLGTKLGFAVILTWWSLAARGWRRRRWRAPGSRSGRA